MSDLVFILAVAALAVCGLLLINLTQATAAAVSVLARGVAGLLGTAVLLLGAAALLIGLVVVDLGSGTAAPAAPAPAQRWDTGNVERAHAKAERKAAKKAEKKALKAAEAKKERRADRHSD